MERWARKYVEEGDTASEVEAVRLTKENVKQVAEWCTGQEVEEIDSLDPDLRFVGLNLITQIGMRRASEGDYIIKDNLGTFHVRWPVEFEAMFKRVVEA